MLGRGGFANCYITENIETKRQAATKIVTKEELKSRVPGMTEADANEALHLMDANNDGTVTVDEARQSIGQGGQGSFVTITKSFLLVLFNVSSSSLSLFNCGTIERMLLERVVPVCPSPRQPLR